MGSDAALVVEFLRKLGSGSSQPFLARADDGKIYVVKYDRDEYANFLFNEGLGSNLYSLFGLACPPWKPLILTNDFVDQNPGCWFQGVFDSDPKQTRATAGLCFGSRFLGSENNDVYQLLPGSWCKRIYKPFDFWRAWFLDICAEHGDTRQALFEQREDRLIQTWFIDHGFMFGGGAKHKKHRNPIASRFTDSRVYGEMPRKALEYWVKAVQSVHQDGYWQLLESIPSDWKTIEALTAFSRFLNRLLDKELGQVILQRMDIINDVFLKLRSAEKGGEWRAHCYGRFYPSEVERCSEIRPDTEWIEEIKRAEDIELIYGKQ